MKASLKGKYEITSNNSSSSAISTITIPTGDFKIKASLTEATLVKPSSLNGLSLSLEKPGFFILDFNVPKKDIRFQFMNSVNILEKRLNLTYIHHKNDNRTLLEGNLVIDPCNKVSANYMVGGSKNGKLKYTYLHQGTTTFEPSYDFGKNCFDFALSKKVYGDDVVKASYQTFNHHLGLEWSRNSKTSGCFKVSALFNLAEENKRPKLMAETTWDFDL